MSINKKFTSSTFSSSWGKEEVRRKVFSFIRTLKQKLKTYKSRRRKKKVVFARKVLVCCWQCVVEPDGHDNVDGDTWEEKQNELFARKLSWDFWVFPFLFLLFGGVWLSGSSALLMNHNVLVSCCCSASFIWRKYLWSTITINKRVFCFKNEPFVVLMMKTVICTAWDALLRHMPSEARSARR